MKLSLYSASELAVLEPTMLPLFYRSVALSGAAALVAMAFAGPGGERALAACADRPAALCGGVRIAAGYSPAVIVYYAGSVAGFATASIASAALMSRAYALIPPPEREMSRPAGDVLCMMLFATAFVFLVAWSYLIHDPGDLGTAAIGRAVILTPYRIVLSILAGLLLGTWLVGAVVIVRKCRHPDNATWTPPRRPR